MDDNLRQRRNVLLGVQYRSISIPYFTSSVFDEVVNNNDPTNITPPRSHNDDNTIQRYQQLSLSLVVKVAEKSGALGYISITNGGEVVIDIMSFHQHSHHG